MGQSFALKTAPNCAAVVFGVPERAYLGCLHAIKTIEAFFAHHRFDHAPDVAFAQLGISARKSAAWQCRNDRSFGAALIMARAKLRALICSARHLLIGVVALAVATLSLPAASFGRNL